MSPEYQTGRADGLREAVEIVRALEAAVARKLERPASVRTRTARQVRRSALGVAATRINTALKRADRRRHHGRAGIKTRLKELGL